MTRDDNFNTAEGSYRANMCLLYSAHVGLHAVNAESTLCSRGKRLTNLAQLSTVEQVSAVHATKLQWLGTMQTKRQPVLACSACHHDYLPSQVPQRGYLQTGPALDFVV